MRLAEVREQQFLTGFTNLPSNSIHPLLKQWASDIHLNRLQNGKPLVTIKAIL